MTKKAMTMKEHMKLVADLKKPKTKIKKQKRRNK